MHSFIKTQAALVAGSLADFLVTIVLVQFFNCWYVAGNAAGNLTGATVQFFLSKDWAFPCNSKQKISWLLIKFMLMWIGNIALSALGIYLLTHYINLHYLLSKLIVSALLGLTYTYLISKKFVFAPAENDK